MTLKYTDYWDKPISENDLSTYEQYNVQYFDKEELQKIESYKNGNLFWIEYFIKKGALHSTILSIEANQNLYVFISEVDLFNQHRHIQTYAYNEQRKPESVSNQLFDAKNNLIAKDFTTDMLTLRPEYEATGKYYYDEKIRPTGPLFDCYFTKEGKLIPIEIDLEEIGMGDHDSTWIYNDEDGIKELIRITGMTRSLAEYYLNPAVIPYP
jgi:hypothetical protein